MRLDAWKAFRQLYPDANLLRDYALTASADQKTADLTLWTLPGQPPTAAQIDQAIVDYEAAEQARVAAAQAEQTALDVTRTKIRAAAQSAVGVPFDQLTAGQTRALLAVLLWREGALTRDGNVRPLAEWARID